MFRAFRIGFTITGRNYTDELQNINSDEYETAAVEILAQVSLFVKPSSENNNNNNNNKQRPFNGL